MAAAVSETTLQNIEEEVEDGVDESTELEKDPVQLKKERTTAKSTHTRVMNKVWPAINNGADRDTIRALQNNLVDAYDAAVKLHDRYLKSINKPQDDPDAAKWWSDLTDVHKATLSAIDGVLNVQRANSHVSGTSIRSSRHSSVSSARAKLLETERLQQESLLKLQQEEEERIEREAEDENMFQAAEYKKRVEAERRRRQIQHEIERQQLSSEILRKQIEDSSSETQQAVSQDPAIGISPPENGASNFFSPTPLTSRTNQVVYTDAATASADASVSTNILRTQLFTPNVNPTRRVTSSVPFPGVLKTLRGFAARTIGAFTPNRASLTPATNVSGNQINMPMPSSSTPHTNTTTPSSFPAFVPASSGHAYVPTPHVPAAPPVTTMATSTSYGPAAPPHVPSSTPYWIPTAPPTTHGPAGPFVPSYSAPAPTSWNQTPGSHTYTTPSSANPGLMSASAAPFVPSSNLPFAQMIQPAPSTGGQPSNPPGVYTPDSWIYQLGTPLYVPTQSFTRPPRVEVKHFNGDPRNWPMFIQSFKSQVHDACHSDSERLSLLRNCLTTDVQKQIGEAMLNPGLYHFALKELHRKFGNPQVVSRACTSSLLKLQPFKDSDFHALRNFAANLHSVVATLQLGGYGMELHSNSTLSQLVSKLPPVLRSRWGEKSWAMQPNLPTVVDFDTWLDNVSMAEFCVRADASYSQQQSTQPPTRPHREASSDKSRRHPRPAVFTTTTTPACPVCKANHHLKDCKQFKGLPVEKRVVVVKENNICYRCLDRNHLSPECQKTEPCGNGDCGGLHHSLLHGAPRMYPRTRKPSGDKPADKPFNGSTATNTVGCVTMLPILPIILKANGKSVSTFALLDTGSEVTLVKNAVIETLGISGRKETMEIETVSGRGRPVKTRRVDFDAESLDGAYKFQIEEARAVDSFNLTRRSVNLPSLLKKWPHLDDVPVHSTAVDEVSILIGQDHPAALEVFESRSDPACQRAPRALSTAFGWCIVGPLFDPDKRKVICNYLKADDGMAALVEDFIQNDTFGTKPGVTAPMGADEKRAWKILLETTKHNGERYESGLLWKSDDIKLENNYSMALNRLLTLERKFIKDPSFAARFRKVMEEYVHLKHARKLSAQEINEFTPGRVWYNPYHAVVNPNKPEKCRVVFDLAAKFKGVSLNDALLKGPDLLGSLIGILLRFRQYAVPLVADVEKMFPQVRVIASDGPAFRYLWRTPGSTDPPDVYQMDVHVFGAISSPAVCSYALRQAVKDSGVGADELMAHIERHFYMDNWLVSFRTPSEAISTAHNLTEALKKGGFPLTQWATANEEVRKALPGRPQVNATLNMDLGDSPVERTLGLCWDFRRDVFILKAVIQLDAKTKRAILSAVASTFDPLGFLAPVIFTAKFLLQDIWRSGADWDVELNEPIVRRWVHWASSLSPLNGMTIKRCVSPNREDVGDIELHIFGDASEMGFGAVAYVRFVHPDGSADVAFLLCKSRIAPLKFKTIPRMELCAAVLATRLCLLVTSELDFQFARTFFWSDSTTVLSWIKSTTCRFNIYVGNRVGEILESSSNEQWNYVPTATNPADDASRGVDATELTSDHRWFVGPNFLSQDPTEWPTLPSLPHIKEDDPEVRSTNWIGAIHREDDTVGDYLQGKSRINKIIRVVAYMQRWAENKRRKRADAKISTRLIGPLTATELRNAQVQLIRRSQEKAYQHEMEDLLAERRIEKNSSLLHLSPFLDHRGLICVGGRIGKAPMPIDVRHPVILSPKERLTELIVFQMHIDCAHPSVDQMCCEVLRQYWIPQGKRTIQKILNKCYICRKYKAVGRPPKMAALPYYRLRAGYPAFTHTGVDYFGPIEVTIFRRKVKRWVCLFTCLSSRAVNLQMAYSMETDSFLIAMNKFELSRGTPASYQSDNGTNFVGAERELAECLKSFDQAAITERLARKGVTWSFNPPAAPHFGGAWERMVRCAKRALFFVLPKRTLTDEMLTNAIAQVENLLNSRKLTKISSDPSDPECLTPHHLLLGRANPNLPPDVFTNADLSSKKRWRQVQAFTNDFWQRWMFEIVASLTKRPKWCEEQRNLAVGDIVILIDDKNPRGTWPLGKVIEIYTADDGVVRSALVQTRGTELLRPAHNLCLLDSVDGPDEDDKEDVKPDGVLGPAEHRAGNVRKRVSFGLGAK